MLVVDAQNRVQSREVQIGVESSNNVEVLSGLNEGERVIVGNLGSYQPGEVVKPKQGALDRHLRRNGGGITYVRHLRSNIRSSS